MRCREVREGNRFCLRNAYLLGEYLRKTVDEERLPRCLPMQRLNHLWREGLPDFIGILSKEFLHLRRCEIPQMELVLDVERRDSPVIVELRDALDADDADAVRARCREILGEVDVTKGMQEPWERVAGDAIKLVNDKHHPLSIQQTPQFFEEFEQRELIAVRRLVLQKTG